MTFPKSPLRTAIPIVTAGFKCASLLPQAIEVNTPAITANAHPAVITIQPLASAFDFFSTTPATTPLPSRISTAVPRNSPRNGEVIQLSSRTLKKSWPEQSVESVEQFFTHRPNQTSASPLSSIVDTNPRAPFLPNTASSFDPPPTSLATHRDPKKIQLPTPPHTPRPAPSSPAPPAARLRDSKCPPEIASANRSSPSRHRRAATPAKSPNLSPSLRQLLGSEMPSPPAPRGPDAPCSRTASSLQSLRAHSLSSKAHTIPKTPAQNTLRRCLPRCAPASPHRRCSR